MAECTYIRSGKLIILSPWYVFKSFLLQKQTGGRTNIFQNSSFCSFASKANRTSQNTSDCITFGETAGAIKSSSPCISIGSCSTLFQFLCKIDETHL